MVAPHGGGAGRGTETFHNLRMRDKTDPDTIVGELAQLGTYGWVWSGLLLTAAAFAFDRRPAQP